MTEQSADHGIRTRAFRGASWLMSGKVLQALFRLGVLGTLSRLLSPADLGLASAAMIVITFFRFFVRNGISPAVVQRAELSPLHERVAFTISVLIGVCAGFLLYWFSEPIGTATFGLKGIGEVLAVIAILLPVQSFGVVSMALLERKLDFSKIVEIEFISYVAYGTFGIVLAHQGFGVWSLVAAYTAESCMRTCLAACAARHSLWPSLDVRCSKELLFYSTGFSVAGMGNFVAGNGDNWIVGRFMGGESLGYYKFAYELTTMISTLLGGILDKVFFPAMARFQHDRSKLREAYLSGAALVSILLLPASAVLLVLAPRLIEIVLGPGWGEVVAPFQILASVLFLRGTYKLSDAVSRATGAVYRRAWRQWFFAVCVVGGGLALYRFGLVGVAVATALAILINSVLMAHLTAAVTDVRATEILAAQIGPIPCFIVSLFVGLACDYVATLWGVGDLLATSSIAIAQGGAVIGILIASPGMAAGRYGAAAIGEVLTELLKLFPALALVPGVSRLRST